MINIPCVIFAGGKSSRMGEDKALLPFAGYKTLSEYQYSRLSKLFSNVYISCKTKEKFNFDAKFIEDIKTQDIFAPTTAFVSIFKTLQENSFFAISVDTPFITLKEIETLLLADTAECDISVAKTEFSLQPLCGIYHRSLEDKFILMLKENNHKLGYLIKSSKTNYVTFEDEKPFLNINYPQDYKEALTLI